MDRTKKRILIVDDEPHNIAIAQGRLSNMGYISEKGYEILTAASAEEGLAAYDSALGNIALMIVDKDMGSKDDGIVFAQTIRNKRTGRNVPIILMSANHDIQEFSEILQGMDVSFLARPAQREAFQQEVTKKLPLEPSRQL